MENDPIKLTVNDAARLMGKKPKALRNDIARRRFPFRKWGRSIVILRADVDAFLADLPGVSVEEAQANAEGNNE